MALRIAFSSIFKNRNQLNDFNRLILPKRSTNYELLNAVTTVNTGSPKNYADLSTNFYHRYSHPNSMYDICFVPEPIPSTTDCLNFYYDKTFTEPFRQHSLDEAIQIVNDLYDRHEIHQQFKSFASVTNDIISTGSMIDSNDARLIAHSWLHIGLQFAVDDIFEDLILKNQKSAEFGIEWMKCFMRYLDRPYDFQQKLSCDDVSEQCVKVINICLNVFSDLIDDSKRMWSDSQHRAWCRAMKHYFRMWIDYEQFIIRSERDKPIEMLGYQLSRTVTIGHILLVVYLLHESWNLDGNYRYDNYFTRIAGLHVAYSNDILSFIRENAAAERDLRKGRVMSYPQILLRQGHSPEDALFKTVNEFNRLMVMMTSIYNDPCFENQRKFFYADIRTSVKYAYLQSNMVRYGWTKK